MKKFAKIKLKIFEKNIKTVVVVKFIFKKEFEIRCVLCYHVNFFFFFSDMECLLCHFVSNVSELKNHYCNFHGVNCKDPHFLDLFKPDYLENNKCSECSVAFSNCRKKKNHMSLFHHGQLGGARKDRGAPLNLLKKGYITYYSVDFRQHNAHYDFYSSDMVDVFLDAVHRTFTPHGNLT